MILWILPLLARANDTRASTTAAAVPVTTSLLTMHLTSQTTPSPTFCPRPYHFGFLLLPINRMLAAFALGVAAAWDSAISLGGSGKSGGGNGRVCAPDRSA